MCVCVFVCVCAYACAYTRVFARACVRVCVCVCVLRVLNFRYFLFFEKILVLSLLLAIPSPLPRVAGHKNYSEEQIFANSQKLYCHELGGL